MKKAKIIIADDIRLIAEACENLLKVNGFKVDSILNDGLSVVKWVRKNRVDLVILDVQMPVMDGIDVLKYFKKKKIDIDVIVLSEHYSKSFIEACKDLNVKGFITKTYCDVELVEAVETVLNGETFFSQMPILESMETLYIKQKMLSYDLSKREKELLPMLEHYTYGEISENEGISINTVKTFFRRIREKVGVNSNIELIKVFVTGNKGLQK